MDTNTGKTTYGQCRCCLAKGHHRDIMKEYYFNGIREVYYDIFMECFNLFLSSNSRVSSLICSTCIHRLRDATSFRMMVASTERQLLDAATAGDDKDMVFVNVDENTLDKTVDVKIELAPVKLEPAEDIDNEDYESDFIVNDYGSDEDLVEGEEALLARFASSAAPLPTRQTLAEICPEYVKHLDSLKGIKIVPRNLLKLFEDHDRIRSMQHIRKSYVTEKMAHIVNASTLLLNSNITPFRSKSRTGFPCFYCRHVFENLDRLREHTAKHKKSELIKILRTYGAECLVVYADITELRCNLCEVNIPSLNELKSHLTNVHKKKMHPQFSDRVIPFKLTPNNVYECQVCGFSFETFGSVERHMNVHFRNYVCKECGTGFVTKYRLKVHIKSMHIGGNHPCEVCGKIFTTQQKHKNHVNTVHKLMKRFKCTKCPERFAEYFRRQKHMVQMHGVAPLKYTCNVCDKTFDRRYSLSRHMKRDHLEERDFQCEMCSYKCFTKNELRVHMIKHNGERIFECSVCKKSYARKKTLKEHMRIHNNDRRFACAVCGQAFVQKCSLKGHLKTHHLEFSLQ